MAAPPDDRELFRQAVAGDQNAFADLLKRHDSTISRVSRRLLSRNYGHPAWLGEDDILQEFRIHLWRHLQAKSPEPPDDLDAWLARVAHNTGFDYLRQWSNGPEIVSLDEEKTRASGEDKLLTPSGSLSSRLREAVRHLPPGPESEVAQRFFLQKMTHKEVAEDMDLTLEQVRYLIRKVIPKIREFLGR